jgi:hypothetical protein
LWISHLHMAYTLPFSDRTNEAKTHVATLTKMRRGFRIREVNACYKMYCFARRPARRCAKPCAWRDSRDRPQSSTWKLRFWSFATNFSLAPDVSFRGEAEVGRTAEHAASVAIDPIRTSRYPRWLAAASREHGALDQPVKPKN